MPDWLKGLLTVLIWTGASIGVTAGVLAATGTTSSLGWLLVLAGIFGFLYGLEAGILTIYDLNSGTGWVMLLLDLTWSLPNTVFGFVFGNIIYIFVGDPSRADSKDQGWIVFKPRGSGAFGNSVLQTLGTVNLGGAGHHERMHLLQARLLGPLYLPLFGLSYVVTSVIQIVWTATLGWILALAGVRQKAYFSPPSSSAVSGPLGWIYYATPFELWAYASGNP